MKKKFLLLLLASALNFPAFGQLQFQKRINLGAGESARSLIKTSDGGYAFTGVAGSSGAGTSDVYVVKLNSSFGIQWTKNIGGNDFDAGACIIQTSDGGYAITGRTNYWEFQIYVLKLDSLGNIQWSKQLNTGLFDQGYSLLQTSDGGIVISGRIYDINFPNYYGVLIKLSSNGNLLWSRSLSGFLDGAYSVVQSSDGAFVVAGMMQGTSMDLLFTKVDSLGTTVWNKTVGGPGSDTSIPGSRLIRTSDNGFAYVGSTDSYGSGSTDMYMVKLSATGALQFAKAIGTNGSEYGYGVVQTTDKGYVICGNILPLGANTSDTYLARVDSLGNLLWTRIIGGSGEENGQSIVQCNDGGLLVAGSTSSYNSNSDVHLIKLEINGTTCGNYTSNGAAVSGGVATTLSNYITSSVNINNVNGPINSYNGGTIYDICGCTFPSATVTAQSLIICSGSNTTLSTNVTTGNTYQWLRNGVVIQGANSGSYAATLSGIYSCIQSNSCGVDTSNNITLTAKGLPSASISALGSTTFCAGDSILLNGPNANNRSYQWMRNGVDIANANASSYYVTQKGSYRLNITNTNTGCSKKGNVISTTSTPLPTATVTPLGPTTFCAGSNVTLQANSGAGYTYQWRKNGSTISGATNINYVATTAGKYKVDVTNGNGCTAKSSNVVVTIPCREGDNVDDTSVQIYPNPTSGIFNLAFQMERTAATQIKIIDVAGRVVDHKFFTEESELNLDITHLENGIYNLLIINGINMYSKKIFKM